MRAAQLADNLLSQGMSAPAAACYLRALRLEVQAAAAVAVQPDRAILLRSAAWLAISAGRPADAARLAAIGLADPAAPERVRSELREVAARAAGQADA